MLKTKLTMVTINHRTMFLVLPLNSFGRPYLSLYILRELGIPPGSIVISG